jgi:hypothetical protein
VSDLLILTMALVACIGGFLANPCGPEQWARVKAARPEPLPAPKSARGNGPRSLPAPDVGIDEDLAGVLA